ncbi:uncharacterized protein TNCV_2862571 [Trichonephila clavipes]|nr:uncharacterized protein TNCV_2862571 [Trichonephila clavipes]
MAPTKPQKAFSAFCGLKPPHFHNDVTRYLNEHLPLPWIGRTGRDDKMLLKWPPRTPDVTPCDFFLWGFIKDKVFMVQTLRVGVTIIYCIGMYGRK